MISKLFFTCAVGKLAALAQTRVAFNSTSSPLNMKPFGYS
jgi:hypothetical protein